MSGSSLKSSEANADHQRVGQRLPASRVVIRDVPGPTATTGATRRAAVTWERREPYFHVSSPRGGFDGGDLRPHADYVNPEDVPELWQTMSLTVDVEAKAKERAVIALREAWLGASALRNRVRVT